MIERDGPRLRAAPGHTGTGTVTAVICPQLEVEPDKRLQASPVSAAPELTRIDGVWALGVAPG